MEAAGSEIVQDGEGTLTLAADDRQGRTGRWAWEEAETHGTNHPQGATTPHQQAGQVVAGHILHHLRAQAHHGAISLNQGKADGPVTQGAIAQTTWPISRRCHQTANRHFGVIGPIEGQDLAMLRQQRLEVGEAHARLDRNGQIVRFVGEDPSHALSDDLYHPISHRSRAVARGLDGVTSAVAVGNDRCQLIDMGWAHPEPGTIGGHEGCANQIGQGRLERCQRHESTTTRQEPCTPTGP